MMFRILSIFVFLLVPAVLSAETLQTLNVDLTTVELADYSAGKCDSRKCKCVDVVIPMPNPFTITICQLKDGKQCPKGKSCQRYDQGGNKQCRCRPDQEALDQFPELTELQALYIELDRLEAIQEEETEEFQTLR